MPGEWVGMTVYCPSITELGDISGKASLCSGSDQRKMEGLKVHSCAWESTFTAIVCVEYYLKHIPPPDVLCNVISECPRSRFPETHDQVVICTCMGWLGPFLNHSVMMARVICSAPSYLWSLLMTSTLSPFSSCRMYIPNVHVSASIL